MRRLRMFREVGEAQFEASLSRSVIEISLELVEVALDAKKSCFVSLLFSSWMVVCCSK
jgi:hypothetical protein